MLFTDEKAFKEGKFDLDCPQMLVRKMDPNDPIAYSGPGFIRQTQDRQLEFKLYSGTGAEDATHRMMTSVNSGRAGTLIPNTDYFELSAVDFEGREWRAARFIIGTATGEGHGVVITGDLAELRHAVPDKDQPNHVILWFADDRQIPAMQFTNISEVSGTREGKAASLNAAEFTAENCKFFIQHTSGTLTVALSSETGLPEHPEVRVVEALEFVLGRTLWASIIQRRSNGTDEITLRPEMGDQKAKLDPPLHRDVFWTNPDLVWMLFAKYFTFIWTLGTQRLHPISGWLHFVRDAAKGSIFTRGLALGVAVEGVLKVGFAEIGEPPSDAIAAIDAAQHHVESWTCDSHQDEIKRRVIGAINALRQTRARDQLYGLAKVGVVSPEQIDTWTRLRNKTAHASPPDQDDLQDWVTLCFGVEVMLYHLIFAAISYSGPYTDYTAPHWVMAQFAPKKAE